MLLRKHVLPLQASYEPPTFPTFSSASDSLAFWKGDMLALGVYEDDVKVDKEKETASLEGAAAQKFGGDELAGIIAELLEGAKFKGKKVRSAAAKPPACYALARSTLPALIDLARQGNKLHQARARVQGSCATARLGAAAKHVALLGLGKRAPEGRKGWGPSAAKAAGAALAGAAKAAKCKSAAFAASDGEVSAQVRPRGHAHAAPFEAAAWHRCRLRGDVHKSVLPLATSHTLRQVSALIVTQDMQTKPK
jgi:Cytosol aminopeptidase family, N-terminal domain